MTIFFRKWIVGAVCFFSLVTQSGCAAFAIGVAAGVAGVGGMAYVNGVLEKQLDYSVAQVHEAALGALQNLEMDIQDDELKRHSAYIKARFPDEAKVRVDMAAVTERVSKLKIRVGIFGDRIKSEMILSAIQKEL